MKQYIVIIASILLMGSCKKEQTFKQEKAEERTGITLDIISIKHGTSFGMCVGYCFGESTYTSGKVVFETQGRNMKTLIYTNQLSTQQWDTFKSQVNIETFPNLPETIGCPDCADGGAEWIEIETSLGQKHKVTFEYLKEPDSLKELAAALRQFEWERDAKQKTMN